MNDANHILNHFERKIKNIKNTKYNKHFTKKDLRLYVEFDQNNILCSKLISDGPIQLVNDSLEF